MRLGIDVGSTTVKCVLFDDDENILFKNYERHNCQVNEKIIAILNKIKSDYQIESLDLAISGSAGMGTAEQLGLEFVQEVYATRIAANHFLDNPDCIIELGGEDAKILFLTNGIEVRMNGT